MTGGGVWDISDPPSGAHNSPDASPARTPPAPGHITTPDTHAGYIKAAEETHTHTRNPPLKA